MVRILLDMCVPDLKSPADIYADEKKQRLLFRKGVPLTAKKKSLLEQNKVEYLEFPLPFETTDPPPYTFSSETEGTIFRLIQETYVAFKKGSVKDPYEIRKQAYELIAQAYEEFQAYYRTEHPVTDADPKRNLRAVVHLRTVGALEDYLYEHAKNVCLTSVALGFDYFEELKQLLAELHKVGVAGMFADIGMMKVPPRILKKDSELSSEEMEKVQTHCEKSAEFVATLFRQKDFVTTQIVLQHHERGQRKGYPKNLLLPQMEPHARLLALVDSYQSMISKRYFRQAQKPIDAVLQLNKESGRSYEERAIRALNFRIAPHPIGSVAQFAGKKLVQVLELTNIPTEFEKTRLVPAGNKSKMYNMPKTVRPFLKDRPLDSVPRVSITDHWEKIGKIVDTYDLLALYGYVRQS